MKAFRGWLNLIGTLYVVALFLFFLAAWITGDGFSDTEVRILTYGIVGLLCLGGIDYVLDPAQPPKKRSRR